MTNSETKGEVKNLSGEEAVDKLKEFAEEKICLFCTFENNKIVSRPMATRQVDDEGIIWFLSDKASIKNMQIRKDNGVYLMYADTGKQHYLTLTGTAEILQDRTKIDELWTPIAKAWFEQGKDDPDISIIKVRPEEGQYWDTTNGKVISMIKWAVAAVTGGAGNDGGVEGKITL